MWVFSQKEGGERGGMKRFLPLWNGQKAFMMLPFFIYFPAFFGTEGQVRICLFFARGVPNGVWFPGNFFCQTKKLTSHKIALFPSIFEKRPHTPLSFLIRKTAFFPYNSGKKRFESFFLSLGPDVITGPITITFRHIMRRKE